MSSKSEKTGEVEALTDFNEIWMSFWQVLYADLKDQEQYPAKRPLLAHYTSIANLEKILVNEQFWLSNPLFMNDHEEVKFGVFNGLKILRGSKSLRDSLGSEDRRNIFYQAINKSFESYDSEGVIDLYVVCFSVHDAEISDGRLSMWRGYGHQGRGAAIVFDTARLPVQDESPLVLGSVEYASQEDRRGMIGKKIEEIAEFLRCNQIPDEYLNSVAEEIFKRICLFAVFSKHIGFKEENEWRLVYFKDRDQSNRFEAYYSYFNGPDGLQPKLKLPVGELLKELSTETNFADLVHSIILGPTSASLLAKRSFERMLREATKPQLIERLRMSGIPFRG